MTTVIDLGFPVVASGTIPIQHRYPLLGALSRVVPAIHSTPNVGVHSIRGMSDGCRRLLLTRTSAIVIRTPVELIPVFLPLAGKRLAIEQALVRLGTPQVRGLRPADNLHSRIVTIKGFMEPESFLEAVQRQLRALEVRPVVSVEVGKRRVLRIKTNTIVGFATALKGLCPEESLLVQAYGLGGSRHLGCGLFLSLNELSTKVSVSAKEQDNDSRSQN